MVCSGMHGYGNENYLNRRVELSELQWIQSTWLSLAWERLSSLQSHGNLKGLSADYVRSIFNSNTMSQQDILAVVNWPDSISFPIIKWKPNTAPLFVSLWELFDGQKKNSGLSPNKELGKLSYPYIFL